MKIELTIDRTKALPKGALPALEKELLKRLNNHYDNCRLTIRRAGSDGLSVFGGDKDDKKKIEEILQETWESADDWFYAY
ncbi:DinI family protein [Salmonella enterica]|nr:DinI family protein [Salmonella enterica]EIK5442501.1 DinI family protein [Salmonella enterica]EKS2959766.1 DinI family protein [Salmonella enterica]